MDKSTLFYCKHHTDTRMSRQIPHSTVREASRYPHPQSQTLTRVKPSYLNDLVWLVSIWTLSTLASRSSACTLTAILRDGRLFLLTASSENLTLEAEESLFNLCCFLAALSNMDFLPWVYQTGEYIKTQRSTSMQITERYPFSFPPNNSMWLKVTLSIKGACTNKSLK